MARRRGTFDHACPSGESFARVAEAASVRLPHDRASPVPTHAHTLTHIQLFAAAKAGFKINTISWVLWILFAFYTYHDLTDGKHNFPGGTGSV